MATAIDIVSQQWFLGDIAAILAYSALVAAALIVALVRRRAKNAVDFSVLSFSMLPMAFVTVALVILSLAVAPLYTPRYLTLTAPAAALLAGWSVGVLRDGAANSLARWKLTAKTWLSVGAVVVLAIATAAALPGYIGARTPYANQSDYSQAAAWIGANARRGDAAIYAMPGYPFDMHVVQYASFKDLGSVDDVMLEVTPAKNNSYWGQQFPFSALPDKIHDRPRVFVVTSRSVPYPGSDIDLSLKKLGYSTKHTWHGPYTEVILATRQTR
jgi:hypothetical protein